MQFEEINAGRDRVKSDSGSPVESRVATPWHSWRSRFGGIGWRLLVRVLFFSSIITLLLTLAQLYLDYRRDVMAIDQRMSEIDRGYRQSLGEGLWRMDARQIELQVEGILRLPDIRYVELREATDRVDPLVVTAGSPQIHPSERREFRITFTNRGVEQLLGVLVVEATFDQIYRRLVDSAAIIMISQAIKTFIISFFILFIVHGLITRHLTAIATSLGEYDLSGSPPRLQLKRRPRRTADELDDLVGAFNRMYARLQIAYGDLQEREAKVRRLVDANIIGILIIDLDGLVLEANDAFLRMVGYERKDLASDRVSWTDLTPPEWHASDAKRVDEMKLTGTLQPFEKEYFHKDGSRVPTLVGVARIDETGNQAVAFVIDLTERKRAEAELAHANRVATMGQLSASIAHEVAQPLAALLTNAETTVRWLARQPPNLEKAKPLIDRIVSDGRRAANIVSRIRDFSKKVPARKETLEINEAIMEIMALTRVATSEHLISIKMRLSEGLPHVSGDKVQLQQVILNLIMNAIEAMSEITERSRELLITTSRAEVDGILVAVSDTGPGLSQANLDRLFEAFYTTKSDGLGMGLSICRAIVQSHGGRLWAEPNKPHGAVFCIMLPIEGTTFKN